MSGGARTSQWHRQPQLDLSGAPQRPGSRAPPARTDSRSSNPAKTTDHFGENRKREPAGTTTTEAMPVRTNHCFEHARLPGHHRQPVGVAARRRRPLPPELRVPMPELPCREPVGPNFRVRPSRRMMRPDLPPRSQSDPPPPQLPQPLNTQSGPMHSPPSCFADRMRRVIQTDRERPVRLLTLCSFHHLPVAARSLGSVGVKA